MQWRRKHHMVMRSTSRKRSAPENFAQGTFKKVKTAVAAHAIANLPSVLAAGRATYSALKMMRNYGGWGGPNVPLVEDVKWDFEPTYVAV